MINYIKDFLKNQREKEKERNISYILSTILKNEYNYTCKEQIEMLNEIIEKFKEKKEKEKIILLNNLTVLENQIEQLELLNNESNK